MSPWLSPLILGIGGVLGYWLHGWIDERFAERSERRSSRRSHRQEQARGLEFFLGRPRALFARLNSASVDRLATLDPPSGEIVGEIETWVVENRARYPAEIREQMLKIQSFTYMLGEGGSSDTPTRRYVSSPAGQTAISRAWEALSDHLDTLRGELHGK